MITPLFQLFNDLKSPYPKNLRLFLVEDNGYLYLNRGHKEAGDTASNYSFFDVTHLDRGKILDAYAKIDFLLGELIRLKTIGFEFEANERLIDLISKFQLDARIRILNDWSIIDNNLRNELKPLVDVRNALSHRFMEQEVTYNGKSLEERGVLRELSEKLSIAWKKLVQIYSVEQNKINIEDIKNKLLQYQNNINK